MRVVEVVEHSPAEASGLHRGDMVLAVNGTPLGNAGSLQRLLLDDAIGSRVEITVLRNGALVDVVAEPTELVDCKLSTGTLRVATYPSSTEPVTLAIWRE